MAISKIKGTIEEVRGESAIIKVWAFKKGGKYIVDIDDIQTEFNDNFYIFSPKFFKRHPFTLGDLIELSISNITYKEELEGSYPSIVDTNCIKTGFLLIEMPLNAFVSEHSLSIDVLSFDISTTSDIYFHDKNHLFGPFKKENQSIKPKIGKDVSKYKREEAFIICGERKYILDSPREKVCDVDCMTNEQLVEFLRTKLANINTIDFNALRKQFSITQLNGLEQARLQKAQKYLSELELNYQIIKNLINENTDFRQIFEKTLEKCKNEIKAEYQAETIQPLIFQKEELQKEIDNKCLEKEKADNALNRVKKELKPLQEQYEHLKSEKERLIQDIKVHALIHVTPSIAVTQNELFYTFEVQDFSKELPHFAALNDYRKIIGDVGRRNFDLLKEYKCLLSNDIELVLTIAKATNNCKVFIQQVEPDWLKFEYFYENGLKQIWQVAHQEPNKIHFLLLQDINMASIECYGKPVLDLLANIRTKLPIANSEFPKNLWIFGFPIELDEDDNFGLPLNKKTFKNWGGLPKTSENRTITEIGSNNMLTVEQIFEYDNMPSNYLNEYFV